MIVLGVLLVAVAVVVSIGIGLRATQAASIDLWWFTVNTTVSVFYFTGLVLMVIAVLGLWLVFRGVRRDYRRRKEMRDLRARAQRAEPPPPAPAQQSRPRDPDPDADDYFESAPREEPPASATETAAEEAGPVESAKAGDETPSGESDSPRH